MALSLHMPDSAQAGSNLFTETIVAPNGLPLAGVDVSVLDGNGEEVATNVSSKSGRVAFRLDPGTYQLHCSKDGFLFQNPTEIEVQ